MDLLATLKLIHLWGEGEGEGGLSFALSDLNRLFALHWTIHAFVFGSSRLPTVIKIR